MKTIEFFIHDSEILYVIEYTQNDILNFIINYPEDWENNLFVKKTLRFYDYLNYEVREIPFASRPVILDFQDMGEINYILGEGKNRIEINRRKIELKTTAGSRFLEYKTLELIDFNGLQLEFVVRP